MLRSGQRLPAKRRGRPQVHQDEWSKVSVVLFNRQVAQLDQLLTKIRGRNPRALNRAAIIRALIDGFLDSRLDMSAIQSEQEFRTRIRHRLRLSR